MKNSIFALIMKTFSQQLCMMLLIYRDKRKAIKKIFSVFLLLSSSFFVSADTLDDLLKKVIEERAYQTEEFQKREQDFKEQMDERQKLFNQAERELREEERISERLTAEYEKNESDLAVLENELNLAVGVLGELFGVVKQVSGDLRGKVLNSLVSAEIPGREKFIESVSTSKRRPSIEQLRKLWFEIQREMTETGKVTQFEAPVISLSGDTSARQITRIGGFNLVSDGEYLSYQGDAGQILELVEQPQRRFTRYIKNVEREEDGENHPMFAVDPSRGSLISILIRKPSWWERIQQGGKVGYLILCLLLLGLGLVIERFFVLRRESRKLADQLKSSTPHPDNPIGQILLVYEKNKNADLESLELRLNEVGIKYLHQLERGVGTIKVFAILSPLMGLLGTVIGMILTFQSITLFGAGDPRMMAGGISQALVTTMLGLCCAIPLLLCHNFITARLKYLIHILEEKTAGLLAEKLESQQKPSAG